VSPSYDPIVCNCCAAGAAYKDGRLRPGDQILEVMKEDLRNVTHSFALHALRQTPNKVPLHATFNYVRHPSAQPFFEPVLWIRIRMDPQLILVGKIRILIGNGDPDSGGQK
jgi:hypothetical protein